jgi:uncharacterized protein (TIGR02145 family)
VCFSQTTPSEDNPVNYLLKEKENLDTKRKASFNLEEIKVRWKKAALENCPGVPCVVTPPAPSSTCGTTTVSDIDGNTYNTVLIGAQCWTKENLKVTKYNDGTLIGDSTNSTWGTAAIGARTGYVATGVSSGDYVGTFGYLYNWYAVNDARKICPSGWHVPTDPEWTIMIQALDPSQAVNSGNVLTFTGTQSTTAGTLMKSAVTNTSVGVGLGWNPGSPGTNTSGFTALPGGFRNSAGSFSLVRNYALFWSATEDGSSYAWSRSPYSGSGDVDRDSGSKSFGASVRCLRD